jgi:hypothetical protein
MSALGFIMFLLGSAGAIAVCVVFAAAIAVFLRSVLEQLQ